MFNFRYIQICVGMPKLHGGLFSIESLDGATSGNIGKVEGCSGCSLGTGLYVGRVGPDQYGPKHCPLYVDLV